MCRRRTGILDKSMVPTPLRNGGALKQTRDARRRAGKWCLPASLVGAVLLLASQNAARSLIGADEVTDDDIGARASAFIRYGGRGQCSGVVYGDSFILTAAHCVVDRTGNKVAVKGLRVFYGQKTAATEESSRRVVKFAFHENYVKQMRARKHILTEEDLWQNVPLNREDIAILKIEGTHPTGSVGTFLPGIDNDYTATEEEGSSDVHSKTSIWFYIYGYFTKSKSVFKLQKMLSGQQEKLQKVIPGRKPELTAGYVYATRQFVISSLPLSSPIYVRRVGMCRGDSGGGVFLAKSDDANYDVSLSAGVPNGSLALKDGHPVLIGLLVHWFVDKENNEQCSTDEEAGAVRIDYYRDWIMVKIKELQ
jgi:hypothetical protein